MRNAVARLLAARGWSDGELAVRAQLDRAHVNQVSIGVAEHGIVAADGI